ncbi:hypothetical protein B0H21DRAFT_688850 [Amylocystis lapponica]|nr:hypothetical protein B0H21DRAFT_688850 [Amylocystis lapponica]
MEYVCENCLKRFEQETSLQRHFGQRPVCRHNHKRARRATTSPPTHRKRTRTNTPADPPIARPESISATRSTDTTRTSTAEGPAIISARDDHPGEGSHSQPSENATKTSNVPFPSAGRPYQHHPTVFEAYQKAQQDARQPPWAPFISAAEWELAEWVVESGVSQRDTDKLLKTKMVTPNQFASFSNNKTFLHTLDSLPGPAASWKLIEITVEGNVSDAKGKMMRESLDAWARDPVEVIADLIGNPEFKKEMSYAPVEDIIEETLDDLEDETSSEPEHDRIFEEMASADWWKCAQLGKKYPEATIAPIILASDKTQLSTFSGDKQAWPLYLSIGNINKDVRRQPSRRATVLLGYLPVAKLDCFRKDDRSLQGYRLFHFAMRQILAPLIDAGKKGVMMNCADGRVRHVFPLLAAYIADYPEQCLICCNKENRCPTCTVDPNGRGELLNSCYRDPRATLATLQEPTTERFILEGLRHVPEPFWADLPLANIFNCIVPDLLHQLHKGVFMNHLVKWTSEGHAEELDARFMRVPPYTNLRIFKKGISTISQWTGNEYRQMEKVFVGLIAGLHDDPRVITAARAIVDFIYLSHYPSHSTSTLEQMQAALNSFHTNKQVFVDLGIRAHFNIPKLHWMQHYIASIIDFGSCDGLSTEISERLHIDFAKLAYRASNRKAYIKQMVVWLTRREKVRWFQGYLRWCSNPSPSTHSQDDDSELDNDVHNPAVTTSGMQVEPLSTTRHLTGVSPGSVYHTQIQASVVVADVNFGAVAFDTALLDFLRQEGTIGSRPGTSLLRSSSYSVFSKFSRLLPSLRGVASDTTRDVVHAQPATSTRASHYSTILFVEDLAVAETLGPCPGYRVGQVRVIFGLPPELQKFRPYATDPQAHLAYIELYTPFTTEPEPHSRLYKISRSYSNMTRKAIVLPLKQVFRSCHLIPVCGSRIDRSWTSDNVLEECDTMYLNPFSDHHMYLFV